MPSPFPGMNPFLEQNDAWEDFHHNFISHSQQALVPKVGPNYIVKVETRLYVHELSGEERKLMGRADVGLSVTSGSGSAPAVSPVETLTAPLELSWPNVDQERYSWLEILDTRTRKVVTAIELLSPTNKKPGPYRDEYLNKRSHFVYGLVNFVEIDLRRGGTRPRPPVLPTCDYYVLVSRKQEWPKLGMWPLDLRDRLPIVPVPLKTSDGDVPLDLQAVLDRTYDAAGYGNYIYRETPEPPLSAEGTAWAEQFMPKVTTEP